MTGDLSIGELSRRAGVKVTTIRFYEGAGLMPKPPRSEGDRRLYDDGHVRRLSFIRHARELGFEMDDLRTLLEISDSPDNRNNRFAVAARINAAFPEGPGPFWSHPSGQSWPGLPFRRQGIDPRESWVVSGGGAAGEPYRGET